MKPKEIVIDFQTSLMEEDSKQIVLSDINLQTEALVVNSFKLDKLILFCSCKIDMRRLLLFVTIVSLVLLLPGVSLLAGYSNATTSTSGYVTYQVTLRNTVNQTSFLVNESSTPTGQTSFVNLTLALSSNLRNFTYSRILNTSTIPEIFPFIPSISNQSFSYETHGVSLYARISSEGTSSVAFAGKTYTASDYFVDFSAANSSGSQVISASGTVEVLPSGLLYSVQIQKTSVGSLSVQLFATNLPISNPASSTSKAEGAALVGAGFLGAAAIAIPWRFKRKRNSAASQEGSEKPSYWVD